MPSQLLVPDPGKKVKLKNFDPAYAGDMNKESAQAALESLQLRMAALQEKLYAQGSQSMLIVLQAMDAGGKDGTIKNVFASVNPQGVKIHSFKVPSTLELAHDFLWRVHQQVPGKGYIGIFNRSHYEDVLVVRVNKIVPEDVWRKRFEHINNFERLLADNGTRILKFFLHISKDEQKKRLQERLDNPDKHWKFSMGDLPVREQWDDYMTAYEDVLAKCSTDHAPWFIVPANRKWYRNYIVTKTIVEALEDMNPTFPPPEAGLDSVVIPD